MPSCHTGLFVDLDGGLVTTDANDLTNEIIVADFNLFKHIVNIEKKTQIEQNAAFGGAHTSSYMATPIMSSATTTGLRRG